MASVDIERVIAYEKAGKIRVQQHPTLPLFIANYTEQCTFKREWDDLTLMCRGLIFDPEGTIVARPFRKFFNLGEGFEPEKPAPLPPDEPFDVTEKMDGSLGILYPVYVNGFPEPYYQIATRGSFDSEQARRANSILSRTMGMYGAYDPLAQGPLFTPGHTYLFEIIYPENRIVVDYGDREMLVLLAIIDNETGEDIPFEQEPQLALYFPVVRRYDGVTGIQELMTRYEGEDNFEGFVLRFRNGLRLKVKLPEYLRLHKLVTGINSRRIWEVLAAGQSLDPFLVRVPEEFYDWVTSERDRLVKEHATISEAVRRTCETIKREAAHAVGVHNMDIASSIGAGREMRKEFALRAARHPAYSGLLFAAYDGADIEPLVWKLLRPETVETPYAPAREG